MDTTIGSVCNDSDHFFFTCTVAPNGGSRSRPSDMNKNVLTLSQGVPNLTHNRHSRGRPADTASSQTQSVLSLSKRPSEGLCPDQSDGLVSPLRGSLPSTAGALSPSRAEGVTQSHCTQPAAQGMENQAPVQTQSLNWTLSGYYQRQKARGSGGVQDTAPYLRLRQSQLGDRATSRTGSTSSNALWSPQSSGLDCLHYSKYGSGAARYRWVHVRTS